MKNFFFFFFIFYFKHVSIADMIISLHIFKRISIIQIFKYSFIEKCIYLTMYLKGLYYYTEKVCLVQY